MLLIVFDLKYLFSHLGGDDLSLNSTAGFSTLSSRFPSRHVGLEGGGSYFVQKKATVYKSI